MTRICLIIEGHKFAVIRDGVLCGVRRLGDLYEYGLGLPEDADIVQDMQELEDRFCLK